MPWTADEIERLGEAYLRVDGATHWCSRWKSSTALKQTPACARAASRWARRMAGRAYPLKRLPSATLALCLLGQAGLAETLQDRARLALVQHYSDPTLSAADNVFVFETLLNCLPEDALSDIAAAQTETEVADVISSAPQGAVACILEAGS